MIEIVLRTLAIALITAAALGAAIYLIASV